MITTVVNAGLQQGLWHCVSGRVLTNKVTTTRVVIRVALIECATFIVLRIRFVTIMRLVTNSHMAS